MSETEKVEKKLHAFYVNSIRYENVKTALTGAEIKVIANVSPYLQLFFEEEGEKPDKRIGDSEAVNITDRVKHFFSFPRATTLFG